MKGWQTEAAKLGVALQLSGHTHGGLIVGIDRLAAGPNGGFVSEHYEVNVILYVNNGTALWPGFALRLGRTSELTRIPSHRVYAGQAEVGVAWSRRSKQSRPYLSVRLDDPSLLAPVYASLLADDKGKDQALVWSRGKHRGGE